MEENIKILEERIDYFKCHPEGCNWKLSFEDEKDIKAIENLIKGYREKEESEKYLYDAYQDVGKEMFEYAEQLEKLESKIKEKINAYSKSCAVVDAFIVDVLQELMEDK